MIFLIYLLTKINSENFQNGAITELRNVTIFENYQNIEAVNLIIKYPFKINQNYQPTFKENSCGNLIKKHGTIHVNRTINYFYEYGKSFFPQININSNRKKRQIWIATVSAAAGYLIGNLEKSFFGKNININTDYLNEKSHYLLCEQFITKTNLYDFQLEINAQKLVQKYFQILTHDIKNYKKGIIFGTKIEKVFINYCSELNRMNDCKKLVQISNKLVNLKGHNFERNNEFIIHLKMNIPRIFRNNGKLRIVTPFPIPIPNSNFYKVAKIEKNVLEYANRSINAELCENYQYFYLCSNIYETSKYDQEKWQYEIINSKKNCILTTLETQIIISSRIEINIQNLKQKIETIKKHAGLHILKRPVDYDIIIMCGSESRKIFFQRNINRNLTIIVNTSEVSIPIQNIEYSENEIYSSEDPGKLNIIIKILTIVLIINVIVTILIILYIIKFKMIKTEWKTKNFRDQSINTSLDSLKC